MENIINYFLEEIEGTIIEKTNLENELKSKKIISEQISKKIDEMIASEDDTDNIFRASMVNLEFHDNEINLLKQQLESNNYKISHYENNLNRLSERVEKLRGLLEEAKSVEIPEPEIFEDTSDDTQEIVVSEEEQSENLLDMLHNISSRIELAVKFGRADMERAKMELNLVRVKLMFCIEDLEKQ